MGRELLVQGGLCPTSVQWPNTANEVFRRQGSLAQIGGCGDHEWARIPVFKIFRITRRQFVISAVKIGLNSNGAQPFFPSRRADIDKVIKMIAHAQKRFPGLGSTTRN